MTLTNLIWSLFGTTMLVVQNVQPWRSEGVQRSGLEGISIHKRRYITYILHARYLKWKIQAKMKILSSLNSVITSCKSKRCQSKYAFFSKDVSFFHGIWNIKEYHFRCFHIMKLIGNSECSAIKWQKKKRKKIVNLIKSAVNGWKLKK